MLGPCDHHERRSESSASLIRWIQAGVAMISINSTLVSLVGRIEQQRTKEEKRLKEGMTTLARGCTCSGELRALGVEQTYRV